MSTNIEVWSMFTNRLQDFRSPIFVVAYLALAIACLDLYCRR